MLHVFVLLATVSSPFDYSAEERCVAAVKATTQGLALYEPCKAAAAHQRMRLARATDPHERQEAEAAVAMMESYEAVGAHRLKRFRERDTLRAEARQTWEALQRDGYSEHLRDQSRKMLVCFYSDPRAPFCK